MMVGIGEIYRATISKFLTDIYWKSLKHFEWQDVERALNAHIYNPDCGQFFPKPADVVRFIEGSGETRALQAWNFEIYGRYCGWKCRKPPESMWKECVEEPASKART